MEGGDNEVHTFPENISTKVNIVACLEFELAYFEASVQLFSITPKDLPKY